MYLPRLAMRERSRERKADEVTERERKRERERKSVTETRKSERDLEQG